MAESKYKVIEGYEVVRLTHAENLQEVKTNANKLQDLELVVVANPPKILLRMNGVFFGLDLTKEVI